ncbi:MAG TPA: FAD:protein FMN transferase [Jatrophihabitans sp.]|nr:FAD:protein FMN transferase [Jatrophihabitans sp.]
MTALLNRDEAATLPTGTWRDWSCLVRLVVADPAALEPAALHLRTLMGRIERAASRFRPGSELSRANALAGRPVPVSPLLVGLVETALAAARQSDGALDPTIGRDLVRLGYDRDIGEVLAGPVGDTGAPTARPANWRDVRLDRASGLLTVPAGTALDLGATAKAQTADRAAAELGARYGCPVLVELGGDLAVAGDKSDWQVTIAEQAGTGGQQISLHAGGLATSTTTVRRWLAGDRPVHHIVDPRTGEPAGGRWRTVTVAAPSAVAANTCSTAAVVLGDAAEDWLAGQRVAARLVGQDGDVRTIGGWPC